MTKAEVIDELNYIEESFAKCELSYEALDMAIKALEAQSESKEIGYTDCGFALLKMWMDNVLTDGEYSHIMDKLNKRWGKEDKKHD